MDMDMDIHYEHICSKKYKRSVSLYKLNNTIRKDIYIDIYLYFQKTFKNLKKYRCKAESMGKDVQLYLTFKDITFFAQNPKKILIKYNNDTNSCMVNINILNYVANNLINEHTRYYYDYQELCRMLYHYLSKDVDCLKDYTILSVQGFGSTKPYIYSRDLELIQ